MAPDRIVLYRQFAQIAHHAGAEYANAYHPAGSGQDSHVVPGHLADKAERMAMISIVFAAMAIETFLNDYAALKLGGQMAQQHIDKLDILSKLVIVTKMATGLEFPKGNRLFDWFRS